MHAFFVCSCIVCIAVCSYCTSTVSRRIKLFKSTTQQHAVVSIRLNIVIYVLLREIHSRRCSGIVFTAFRCPRLQSASTSTLVGPPTRRATIGDRAFLAAASRAWNSLPTSVREIQSLPAFGRTLKTALFAISFPTD